MPALVALGARFGAPTGPAGAFRAAVLGLAAAGLVGAFTRARALPSFARLVGAAAALGAAVTWGAPHATAPDGAFVAIASLGLAAGLAPFGLASLGRALRCPDPGAGVAAFLVLVAGLASLSWVDAVAEAARTEARGAIRQAVLRADLATAAAYDVAGYDRLHEPETYDTTTIASLPVELPRALSAAAGWSVVGAGAAAMGALVCAVRRRRTSRRAAPTGVPA